MDFKGAAYQILKKNNKPLSSKEIITLALEEGIISSSGKTPEATMAATLYTDIKKRGKESLFIKVSRGKFGLSEWYKNNNLDGNSINNESIELKELTHNLTERQFLSDYHTKFEESIKEAFNFLGYEAELIGGSGETDVLLTANIGKESYKVNVDGKTSKSGKISTTQIDFISLDNHKKKNNVDFVVIVGPDFSGGELNSRARGYQFSLLRTDSLVKLLKAHAKFPFTLTELKDLFAGEGGDITSQLEDLLSQNYSRRNILEQFRVIIKDMQSIQDKLGYFSVDSLASREKMEDAEIQPYDIEYLISLLKLPFINGIKEVAEGRYILTIKIDDIANIFYQISLLVNPEKDIEENNEEEKTPKVNKLGTKYYDWFIRGHSITAYARKESPYPHYCPLIHFKVIIEKIIKGFEERNLINTGYIFSLLEGENLAPNRPFKGKAEEYKIGMVLGVLEMEKLIKWTGSKRPVEYKLNTSLEELKNWLNQNIVKEIKKINDK